jgi:hypothetical protein
VETRVSEADGRIATKVTLRTLMDDLGTPIPEPASLAPLGLAALLRFRRR